MNESRKRLLDRGLWEEWPLAEEYECMVTCDYLDIFEGYGAMTRISKSALGPVISRDGRPLKVIDDGFIWIQALPIGKNYSVILMMDENFKIIQWYFDITSENGVDSDGQPYLCDLYLDLVLYPDGEMCVLDEDELSQALANGDITPAEFSLAREEIVRLQYYLRADFDGFKQKSDSYIEYFKLFL